MGHLLFVFSKLNNKSSFDSVVVVESSSRSCSMLSSLLMLLLWRGLISRSALLIRLAIWLEAPIFCERVYRAQCSWWQVLVVDSKNGVNRSAIEVKRSRFNFLPCCLKLPFHGLRSSPGWELYGAGRRFRAWLLSNGTVMELSLRVKNQVA